MKKSTIDPEYLLVIVLFIIIALVGCDVDKPTVKFMISINEIQGKWKLVELTDPNGFGFEPDVPKYMVIEGNNANYDGELLRLELATDDSSYMRLFKKVDGIEKNIGEHFVLTSKTKPIKMIWMDRDKPKQISIFQK